MRSHIAWLAGAAFAVAAAFSAEAGTLDQAMMLRLKSVAADLHDASGDDRLDQVLAEIDLRVAVELAKAGLS